MPSRLAVLAALALAFVGMSPPAGALAVSESATLDASFNPDRLGAPTTITFGFHLATSEGMAPPPLISVDLKMPAGINYTTTTLGLAICRPAALLARGLAGRPPNSRLGFGSADTWKSRSAPAPATISSSSSGASWNPAATESSRRER